MRQVPVARSYPPSPTMPPNSELRPDKNAKTKQRGGDKNEWCCKDALIMQIVDKKIGHARETSSGLSSR